MVSSNLPTDWSEPTIVDVAEKILDFRGRTPKKLGMSWGDGSIPAISARNVRMGHLDFGEEFYLGSEALYRRWMTRGDMELGDVLITTEAPLGNVAAVPDRRRYILSQRVVLIRPKREQVDKTYLLKVLQAPAFQALLVENATGSTALGIQRRRLEKLTVPVPPLPEQRRIASALESVDNIIDSLGRLITKKQAIKQGMMQELLTGRTRLPGFAGKWSEVTAGDIGTFKGGSGFPLRFQGSEAGQFPFFKVSDMNTQNNELFMIRANNYVSETQRKQMAALVMPPGAIVFAKVGAAVFLERKRILTVPSCIDNNLAAFILDTSRVDIRFIHYVLCSFRMGSLVATGALPSLNGRQLRSIPIALPDQISEQQAIARALADADFEIDALQRRITKARDIKQGMMQELLTGRTRLPVSGAVA